MCVCEHTCVCPCVCVCVCVCVCECGRCVECDMWADVGDVCVCVCVCVFSDAVYDPMIVKIGLSSHLTLIRQSVIIWKMFTKRLLTNQTTPDETH